MVVGDLRIERGRPGGVRRRPRDDGRKDRREQVVVFQQRHLKLENLRGIAADRIGQPGDLPAGGNERRAQRRLFVGWSGGNAPVACRGIDPHERPVRKTDGCRAAPIG